MGEYGKKHTDGVCVVLCQELMEDKIIYGNDVKKALESDKPVVALESTIIAHGFPYPQNYELAVELETLALEHGVTPATIGIVKGKIKVGLEQEEIYHMASQGNIPKASMRDIPVLVAKGLDGATTVASTMAIAHLAGIKVFVTGGIGGVHRGGEHTMDVSADLPALAKYSVVVVCAGAKSVLDLPKTLEVLETLGVSVLGYQSDQFPAFYLRDSGLKVDYRVDSGNEIANILRAKNELKLAGGLLVTVPIPAAAELVAAEFNSYLADSLAGLQENNITGKEVTPYLLKSLHQVTQGESVKANIALIKNNLLVGSEVARAIAGGVS